MKDSDQQVRAEKVEIEVTPAMVDAGIDVLLGYFPDSICGDKADRRMVEEVFISMNAARSSN
jgi:hypothetical protein